jgi:flagellar motor switch protein FliN
MPIRGPQGQDGGNPIHLTMSFEDDEGPEAGEMQSGAPATADVGSADAEAAPWQRRRSDVAEDGDRGRTAADTGVGGGSSGGGSGGGGGRGGKQERSQRAALLPQFAGIELSLTVEVGSLRIALKDLVAVEPGQLLALDRMTNEPVSVLVNGKPFARGEIVAVGDRYGVRLLEIVTPAGGAG